MKSRQFCSVCKKWLEMEVVPTSDGEDDDGVIWFRCPQCQGFLPKLSGADLQTETGDDSGSGEVPARDGSRDGSASSSVSSSGPDTDQALPWDSPADMMAARRETTADPGLPDLARIREGETVEKSKVEDKSAGPTESAEPIEEFAALLAAKDQSQPTPYRPWESYEVGQCIHHLAWEDCGVVVAKEKLPGGRRIIKCYFEEAGVVRLIEKAPR